MIFEFSNDDETIEKILRLQYINLRFNLTKEEIESQGFVYVQHTKDSLKSICDAEPAVIARDELDLAGYALCMSKSQRQKVPELIPFFESLDMLNYQGQALKKATFIICGQICIAKPHRGKNLMRELYNHMKQLNTRYHYCITEVSSQNIRSLHAHYKVGFKSIFEHKSESGELWHILLWDWNQ